MDMNPDMDLSNSKDWGFTMASDSRAGYSHQAISPCPPVSSSTSLHNAQTIPLLLLPTQWLLLQVGRMVDVPLGVFSLPANTLS